MIDEPVAVFQEVSLDEMQKGRQEQNKAVVSGVKMLNGFRHQLHITAEVLRMSAGPTTRDTDLRTCVRHPLARLLVVERRNRTVIAAGCDWLSCKETSENKRQSLEQCRRRKREG